MEITKEIMEELYLEKKMGIKRISKYLGVGERVVRTRLNRFNIPMRKWGEIGIPPRLGVKLSNETKNKISNSHKGKKLSEQHKESISRGLNSKREWINNGYVYIRLPEHPNAYKGRIKRATIIAEDKIGRYLEKGECVHHINGIKDDDSSENLVVLKNKKHSSYHCKERWENGEMKKILPQFKLDRRV